MVVVELYTDGACKHNPGVGGWGVLMRMDSFQRRLWGGEAETTNNRMELTAAIEGLQALNKPSKVRLTTDSVYVKNGITQWIYQWRQRNWLTSKRNPVVNKDLWQLLEQAIARHQVEWCWIKGHSGHEGNEYADQLANKGVEAVQAGALVLRFDSGREKINQEEVG